MDTKSFGLPWEKQYGYSQAVKVGDTDYLSRQVSHDENGLLSAKDIWRPFKIFPNNNSGDVNKIIMFSESILI